MKLTLMSVCTHFATEIGRQVLLEYEGEEIVDRRVRSLVVVVVEETSEAHV